MKYFTWDFSCSFKLNKFVHSTITIEAFEGLALCTTLIYIFLI